MNMKLIISIWLTAAALVQAAGLEFSEPLKEVHPPVDVSTYTADFNFTNKSDKPVTIAKADPSCSCIKAQISNGKLKYAPGESGTIRTTFEMGNFSGIVDKTLPIYLEGDPADKPSIQLTLRVHIPVLVGLEPKTLRWEVDGKPDPKTIQIRMAEGQTIRVTKVTSSSEAFKYELKTLEEGKSYDLIVTPMATNAPAITVIRIDTDSEIAKVRTQQAFAVMQKPSAPKP
jgi:hypothetical protein